MVVLSEANDSRYESLNYIGAGGKAWFESESFN